MTKDKLTILVSGMIAGDPGQGGAAWAVLQYVLGLRELGFDAWFVEPVSQAKPEAEGVPLSGSQSAAYFRQVVADFGLEGAAALVAPENKQSVGLPYSEVCRMAERTDALINISGMMTDEAILDRIPVRVYLDLDPAFNQLWHAQGIDMRFSLHTHFVTIGKALGREECRVPTCALPWITTFQPVVLSRWPVASEITRHGFTTIGNWRSYGSIEHDGVCYGQKAHSLRPLMELPRKTSARFMLAMAIHSGEHNDLALLRENGWTLLDPREVAATPAAYQRFIQGSLAELGIAKSGYVESQCGWFSDRSLCYLASGRPVVAQETGFSEFLPTGAGLLAFRTLDEAVAAIEEVVGDYARHRRAARRLAEEYFASEKVLSRLLQRLGVLA
jgi:hypothetical protein